MLNSLIFLVLAGYGVSEGADLSSSAVRGLSVAPAVRDARGWFVHAVRSEYQAGETKIRVLLPDRLQSGRRYRVLYVLPVEAKEENRYGDGLQAVRSQDLHNRYAMICVAPTFSHLPWYTDHPTDPEIRQESYLLKVVVPAVESHYPAIVGPEGRWLLGFSKSGWGAWSLLLRHPEVFARAAAWDAPLAEPAPVNFGSGPIFGTQENFERYRVETLLRTQAARLGKTPRLVLSGYANFRRQHVRIHEEMTRWGIPHVYRDGPKREHRWDSGWLPEAVELLAGMKDDR
jgi:S-formylglutathione hydrolase FrmB